MQRLEKGNTCTLTITNVLAYFSIKEIASISIAILYNTKIIDSGVITNVAGKIFAASPLVATITNSVKQINAPDTYTFVVELRNVV